ncbi:MAG: hypothetical protein RRZ65_06895 [Tannerellaceae bacterium]
MKNCLFIIGVFLSLFLFVPMEDASRDEMCADACETVMQKNAIADMEHHLAVLSSELKESNALTPRRNIQTTSFTLDIRLHQGAVRVLQDYLVKGHDRLRQVSESVSISQTINYYTLLCRTGYHIYTLRKILI